MNVIVRQATEKDAKAIADTHIRSWHETYRGIVDDAFLITLNLEARVERWRTILSQRPEGVFVAEHDEVIGFVSAGKSRSLPDYESEIYALYLLKRYQGLSIGKRLFKAAADYLHGAGNQSMYVAVLKDNPAIGFYTKMGGSFIGSEDVELGDKLYPEELYGWRNLAVVV